MAENYTDEDLQNILSLYKRALPLKELPRIGWLMEGCTRTESDSIAAHSYCVALISYLTATTLEERRQSGKLSLQGSIRWDRVLAMAVLHDLAESVTGDMSTGFKRYVEGLPGRENLIQELEHGFLRRLVGDELTSIVEEYDSMATPEARIVKFADVLDAFAFAQERMGRTFPTYLASSRKKLCRPCSEGQGNRTQDAETIGRLLADWLDQAIDRWGSIQPALAKGGYVLAKS